MQLLLASASPQRLNLCQLAGLRVQVVPVDVEKPPSKGENPHHYVEYMAKRKVEAVFANWKIGKPWVIGADTVIVASGGKILGKPENRRAAKRMLRLLMGRDHRVLSGLCVARKQGHRKSLVVETLVSFCDATDREIDAYLDTNEWRGKAGAYALQGRAGARFVARVVGSVTNVVGLPTVELRQILREFDVL